MQPARRSAAALLAACCLTLVCTAFQDAEASSSALRAGAYRCHSAGAILFGLMGLVYLGRREFMPYHAIAVGKSWGELGSSEKAMFLASMRIIGAAWVALALALGLLLRNGFRADETWAVSGVPAVGLLVSVPTLLAVLHVKRKTPASPPWPPLAVAVLLFLTGLALSFGAA